MSVIEFWTIEAAAFFVRIAVTMLDPILLGVSFVLGSAGLRWWWVLSGIVLGACFIEYGVMVVSARQFGESLAFGEVLPDRLAAAAILTFLFFKTRRIWEDR